MVEDLLIFVGYAQDAREEALSVREMQPVLQASLNRLKKLASISYGAVKIFNWEYDADLVVGGQSQVINPHLKASHIAVFVFKETVGRVTWEELSFLRSRPLVEGIPILALFPAKPPDASRLMDTGVAMSWSHLLAKRNELTQDWTEENSKSITPIEPYRDLLHLKQILVSRLEDVFVSLFADSSIQTAELKKVTKPDKSSIADGLDTISSFSEFDPKIVDSFRLNLRIEQRARYPMELSNSEFLNRAGFLQNGFLTRAGVLLFSRNPSLMDPSAFTRLIEYHGYDKTSERSRLNSEGPIYEQINEAFDFVASRIETRESLTEISPKSSISYQYPMICVREIIANALCHREYNDQGRATYVRIFSNRIEISSSGEWVNRIIPKNEPVLIENLIGESVQRNMRLAHAISSIGLMEVEGSGIPTAVRNCKERNAPIPTVTFHDGYITITIYPSDDWFKGDKKNVEQSKLPLMVRSESEGDHLEMLRKGVKEWNMWRLNNPDVKPKLGSAHLARLDLRRINFTSTNLVGADLIETDLSGADLTKADLSRADLIGASLENATLEYAQCFWTNFTLTNLNKTILRNTALGRSIFFDNDLSSCIGLDECVHVGPSIVDTITLTRTGELPLSFLQGIGLPDNYIDYIPSLFSGGAIAFYSVFITYSQENEDFAKRLYADLQDHGVRCWFAPEDMKIGDKIRHAIDSVIRLRDKLLIILSEDSVQSQWVETEVETALEEERERGETVLFPVKIDDAVMNTSIPWARQLVRTRHIGDFGSWKRHDDYQKSFDRLLQSLKAE